MKVIQQPFGEIDGEIVHSFTLKNNHGFEVTCLNYGCIITKVMAPDADGDIENIVLGFDTIEEYLQYTPYFGAVVGRVAGRIKNGEFELDGKTYHVTKNENSNHLHGGNKGFSHVLWNTNSIEKDDAASVEFYYTSPDGEEGYPGGLDMKVVYTINDKNELTITYQGKSDQTTLLNVTNHSYFNLSGNLKRDILKHQLTLKSDRFLELDKALLPTGDILDVENTPFDFRSGRFIEDGVKSGNAQNHIAGFGYDHPFLLSENQQNEIVLNDQESGRELVIETDQPCVVLYTGNQMEDHFTIRDVPSRKYLGLCLETQGLPDAIHHPHFPSCVLEAGETYHSETKYAFRTRKRGE
jgi:aldose 1-epimerase